MKHKFEKYFPLPWDIETDEDESYWMITPARGSSFLDFGAIKVPKFADVRDVMNYIILCANLMPEAVELLKDTNTKLKRLCEICGTENIGNECIRCTMPGLVTRVDALLAKLEGGAEDAVETQS